MSQARLQYPAKIHVYVKDAVTLSPIVGCIVKVFFGGELAYSETTDSKGSAEFWVIMGASFVYEASALGYETATVEKIIWGEEDLVILLTASVTPPIDRFYVDVCCVDSTNRRVFNAKVVSAEFGEVATSEDGFARLILSKGTHALTIEEYEAAVKIKGIWARIHFPSFTASSYVEKASVYTAWVEQGILSEGSPPPPPPPDFWDWLLKNWPLVLGGLGVLAVIYVSKPPTVIKIEKGK